MDKVCTKCGTLKSYDNFHKHKQCIGGYNTVCKECRKPLSKESYQEQSLEYKIWYRAKSRAKIKKLEFNIQIEDIVVPSFCPVLGTSLSLKDGDINTSPSIDRIDSSKGYIKTNIRIISNRANILKNNATIEELEKVLEDLKRVKISI